MTRTYNTDKRTKPGKARLYRWGPRRPQGMRPYGNEHMFWGEYMGGLRTTADGATPSNAKTGWRRLARKAQRAQAKAALRQVAADL